MKHMSELRVKDYIEERPSQLFTQLLTEQLRRESLKNLNDARRNRNQAFNSYVHCSKYKFELS